MRSRVAPDEALERKAGWHLSRTYRPTGAARPRRAAAHSEVADREIQAREWHAAIPRRQPGCEYHVEQPGCEYHVEHRAVLKTYRALEEFRSKCRVTDDSGRADGFDFASHSSA